MSRPQECTEGRLTDINHESGGDDEDEAVPEEVTLGKENAPTLQERWEVFHNTESTDDKVLEADSDLERERDHCQSTENVPPVS